MGFTVVGTAFVIGALFTLFTGSLTFCSSLGRGTTFFLFIFLTGYFPCLVSRGTSLLSTTVIITYFLAGTASKWTTGIFSDLSIAIYFLLWEAYSFLVTGFPYYTGGIMQLLLGAVTDWTSFLVAAKYDWYFVGSLYCWGCFFTSFLPGCLILAARRGYSLELVKMKFLMIWFADFRGFG